MKNYIPLSFLIGKYAQEFLIICTIKVNQSGERKKVFCYTFYPNSCIDNLKSIYKSLLLLVKKGKKKK